MITALSSSIVTTPAVSVSKAQQSDLSTSLPITPTAPISTGTPTVIAPAPTKTVSTAIIQAQLPNIITTPVSNTSPTSTIPSQASINTEYDRIFKQITNNIVGNLIRNFTIKPGQKMPNLAQMNSMVTGIIPFARIPLNNARELITSIDARIAGLRAANPNDPNIATLTQQKTELQQLATRLQGSLTQLETLRDDIRRLQLASKAGETNTLMALRLLAAVNGLKSIILAADAKTKPTSTTR